NCVHRERLGKNKINIGAIPLKQIASVTRSVVTMPPGDPQRRQYRPQQFDGDLPVLAVIFYLFRGITEHVMAAELDTELFNRVRQIAQFVSPVCLASGLGRDFFEESG